MGTTSARPDDDLSKALARVAELEAELRVAQEATQSAKQELQYFVFAANHDLLEPLRAITTYSQLLERLYSGDPETAELTGFIVSGVQRLKRLLENLVAYARVDPAPATATLNLAGPVHTAVYKLSALIRSSNAQVDVIGDLPQITANEAQVTQLVEQLLSNAILYKGQASPVIRVEAEESEVEDAPTVTLRVIDNGGGIQPQYFHQVLQPFKRLHGKEIPGNGLGLSICDKIMRAHQGKLWIESDGESWTAVHAAFPL